MPLPSRGQYEIAVQNPGLAFADRELQQCSVECKDGIPVPYSGAFATTWRMKRDDSAWAVRCFTKPVPQLEKRYSIIGDFLSQRRPEFLIGAELLVRGIRIGADWHPAIKMRWLSGRTLNTYIGSKLRAPTQLILLRGKLLEMAGAMQSLNMAHGDLQARNVIVSRERLYLVDYDGIYVPGLRGLPPGEIGHPHYQHPERCVSHWGPAMDSFSLIVLYIGISAVALQPELWDEFDNGLNVLFNNIDFADPQNSLLFRELLNLPNMGSMPERLQEICAAGLDAVPTLNDFVAQETARRRFMDTVGGWLGTARPMAGQVRLAATDRRALLAQVGSEVTVYGVIAGTHKGLTKYGKPYLFLNVGVYPNAEITFIIWSDGLEKYDARGLDPASLVGVNVEAQGTVGLYENRLEITIDAPARLRIIG